MYSLTLDICEHFKENPFYFIGNLLIVKEIILFGFFFERVGTSFAHLSSSAIAML